MGAEPVRVVVVNDYEVVVAGVKALLQPYADRVRVVHVEVAGESVSEDGAAPALEEVDVVLYDTYGALAEDEAGIRSTFEGSGARLVLYTWPEETARVERSLADGAAAFVSKGLGGEQLAVALERIRDGDREAGSLGDGGGGDAAWPGQEHRLSARESEIVALIARGLSNQEIAEHTFLSVNSIKTYIRTAYRKMGVTTRAQAVIWAVTHGFTPGAAQGRRAPSVTS